VLSVTFEMFRERWIDVLKLANAVVLMVLF
jgi:hypothetical protein